MNTLCQRLRGGTFPTDDGKDDRGYCFLQDFAFTAKSVKK